MTRKEISDGVGNISTRHIQEAENYRGTEKKIDFFKNPFGRLMIAVVLALCILAGGIRIFFLSDGMVVTVYAHGTDEKITQTGVVINTGKINNNGKMTGHPLMFYLSGKDISTVRFSCKNQQINFMDWTEKRDEFGLAQNFTVSYGENESEYYYLLIDWVPNATIRELTDNADSTIATLPQELREDVIVMEIIFENGKSLTKAITVSLLNDGTFFASFNDYKITSEDNFIDRPDSKSIPRDILYTQGSIPNENDKQLSDDSKTSNTASIDTVKAVAEAYYKNTVFSVISMEIVSQTENEISFSVCVSKGGVMQEPNRTIFLELANGHWKVVNEGIFSVHSASLKPVSTVSSSTTSGRFTSIPSVARSFNCSSSLISGNLSFNCMLLYKSPLVLKNLFNGSPLFLYHSFNSS